MRWVLIFFIGLYRLLPDRLKRDCLFKETCSLFVLRAAKERGFLAGCRAMIKRFARCRPGYLVYYHYPANDWQVEFVDGATVGSAEVADFVLAPYRAALAGAVENYSRTKAYKTPGDVPPYK